MAHKYIGDIHYTTQATRKGEKKLLMDFALPDPTVWPGPRPVILIIHGGTWVGWRLQEDLPWRFVDDYGFALARFDYRIAYEAPFPSQVADCRSAVRFVRKHAAEYGIDPDRIGIRGCSAGGHLAAMIGVSDGAEGLDNPGDDPAVPVTVQAVVDNFGPTNILQLWQLLNKVDRYIRANPFGAERKRLLDALNRDPNTARHFIRAVLNGPAKYLTMLPGARLLTYLRSPKNLLGISRYLSDWSSLPSEILKDENVLRRVSPIEYLTGAYRKDGRRIPPFWILHGVEDAMVPFEQSQAFVEELRKVGTDVTFDNDCAGCGHFPPAPHWHNVINPKEMAFFKRTIG